MAGKYFHEWEARQQMDHIFDEARDPIRKMMERVWYRNILYYIGEQYLEWVVSLNVFRKKTRRSPFKPTPVDNIIREYVRSMKALILGKNYIPRVWPNSNSQEDREAGELGQELLTSMDMDNESAFLDEKERVLLWVLLCGVGFLRTFAEKDGGEWFFDAGKNLITEGDVATETWIPFNVIVDPLGEGSRRKRYMAMKSLKYREWVEDTFHKKISGADDPSIVNYQQMLMDLVANVSPWKGSGLETRILNMRAEDLVVFKEAEFKPTKKNPEGRYVAACGDTIMIDANRMPIPAKNGKWFYTLTDFHYNYVPGRFWSDPGVNDLISPQNSINEIDQALNINRKALGRTRVLMPSDVKIKALNEYGSQFLVLQYDSLMAAGLRPEFQQGIALPEQVVRERMIHRETVQELSGDPKNILRGKVPSAKASGIMVDILKEAAEAGHGPDIARIYRSYQRVYRKRLILASHLFTEERMIKTGTLGSDVQVKAFKAAQLRGNTDVRLELDSGVASTRAGKTQTILNLVEAGMFPDIQNDVETRMEILRRVGLSGFKDKTSPDVKRAELENTRLKMGDIDGIMVLKPDPQRPGEFLQETHSDDPLFKYDDHIIHFETHRRLIVSPEFQQLKPHAQAITLLHTDTHYMFLQAKMESQGAGTPLTRDQAEAGERTTGGAPSVQGNQAGV